MNTVAVTINLPMAGASRQDYLHCVSSALMAAQSRGDTVSAMALAGLMQLVDEAINTRMPHFVGVGQSAPVAPSLDSPDNQDHHHQHDQG